MKIITGINLSILLLTTSFSALADEDSTATNTKKPSYTLEGSCSPVPDCELKEINASDTFEQWIDRLTMQQLIELLKTKQKQPVEAANTHNE